MSFRIEHLQARDGKSAQYAVFKTLFNEILVRGSWNVTLLYSSNEKWLFLGHTLIWNLYIYSPVDWQIAMEIPACLVVNAIKITRDFPHLC